jgi:hypothetical protein
MAILCLAFVVHTIWRMRRDLTGAPVLIEITLLQPFGGLKTSDRLKVNIRQAYRLTAEGRCVPMPHWTGERTITIPHDVYKTAQGQNALRLVCFPNGTAAGRLEDYLRSTPSA